MRRARDEEPAGDRPLRHGQTQARACGPSISAALPDPVGERPWILVVDDDPTLAKLVQDLLSRSYLVDIATHPREAQAKLRTRSYDVVLTDMVMPELSGLELVQFVKLHHPHTPVIVFTGFANFKDAVTAVKLGAFDYLSKPVQGEMLRHALTRALEFRRLKRLEEEMEILLAGAEALGWQSLELLAETPEAALLASLKEACRQAANLTQAAERVLEGAELLLGATRSSVFLYQSEERQFIGLAARGPEAEARRQAVVPLGEGVMGQVAVSQRPLLVREVNLEPRLSPSRFSYRTSSFLILPVKCHRFWGVLNVTDRQDGTPFTARELFLGWLLARLLAEHLESRQPAAPMPEAAPLARTLLQEQLPVGLALVDRELTIVVANRTLARLAEVPAEDLAGASFPACLGLSPGDQEAVAQALKETFRDGEPREFPILKSHRPGRSPCYLGLKLLPSLAAPEEQPVLAVVEDVSEVEQLRQRLHLYEHLAIMGKLSLCVAHELNNPLDGIRRYISLAQRKKDQPEEVERYLNEALKGLQKMSLTIRSLLSSANPLKAPRTTDNLLNLLQEAVKIMMFQASDHRVQVDFHPSSELRQVPVEGDLYHVFINLIKNALQAMPQGGRLLIQGSLTPQGVEISFQDTGPGLRPEEVEQIFQPFYSTKEGGEGLGLGLPICRKILERYHGSLTVESEPGAGTCVRILLPQPSSGGQGGKEQDPRRR